MLSRRYGITLLRPLFHFGLNVLLPHQNNLMLSVMLLVTHEKIAECIAHVSEFQILFILRPLPFLPRYRVEVFDKRLLPLCLGATTQTNRALPFQSLACSGT